MSNSINFLRVNNDVNGNPRYVCHFLNLLSEAEKNEIIGISAKYDHAIRKAKKIGGKKYHNKSYGGGIVFQSYNIRETEQQILALTTV